MKVTSSLAVVVVEEEERNCRIAIVIKLITYLLGGGRYSDVC